MNAAVTFAVVFAALWVGHQVGDHWVQTERQAATKMAPGWGGRRACAAHVVTLTVTKAACLGLVVAVLGVRVSGALVATGLALDAASHYWADRRVTLRKLASEAGHSQFWRLGQPREGHDDNPVLGTGAYALDQSWHAGWLFLAALIASVGAR